jgi:hypothetical protein
MLALRVPCASRSGRAWRKLPSVKQPSCYSDQLCDARLRIRALLSTVGWVEERNPTVWNILIIPSLPLGVHLFCLPKINEPNKRTAHARPAGSLRFSIWSGMTETPFGQTTVMLIRPALRCSASHKGVISTFRRLVLNLRNPTFGISRKRLLGFISFSPTYSHSQIPLLCCR